MDRLDAKPTASFSTGIRLFVIILAVVHAVAFATIWVQAAGLIGPSGILPADRFLQFAREQLGGRAWFDLPSLCWIFGAGRSIDVLCGLGVGLAALLLLGYARPICLALLWALYLSLTTVGQQFFNFQWDTLLLECTLIAVFVVPWSLRPASAGFDPPKLARYLVWWLLVRLMFLSGALKLTSGDPAWRRLTALTFHYQTQPLPTPLAWYAQHFPLWFQEASCAIMFAVELLCPLCIVGPRRVRHTAAVCLAALQILIALTGNYAFFNLLSFGLCLACFDDGFWLKLRLEGRARADVPDGARTSPVGARPALLRWFAALSIGITFFQTVASLSRGAAESPLVQYVDEVVEPFRSFNTYGLFRVMTTERPELIFEGSDDGQTWLPYGLPYKPGDLSRRPRWVAPYQPRLDWQLWFAALGPPEANSWVRAVCGHLLLGEPAVLGLFSQNPFPDHPPRYVRVVRYIYEFTTSAERKRTGNWWQRTPLDFYIPPVSLSLKPK
jgi:lipase maturation factor 1